MKCEHWVRTVPLPHYGWITVCEENCGWSESAEHSPECFEGVYRGKPCICGAEKEYREFSETRKGQAMTDAASGKDGAMTFEECVDKHYVGKPPVLARTIWDAAFRAGAESMRERAAEACEGNFAERHPDLLADAIRALPLEPEE